MAVANYGAKNNVVFVFVLCITTMFAVAEPIPPIKSDQLLTLDHFTHSTHAVGLVDDLTLDERVLLMPLTAFHTRQGLDIDTRLGQLRVLADLTRYEIDPSAAQLMTLADIASRNRELAEATQRIEQDQTLSLLPSVDTLVDSDTAVPVQDIQLPELAPVAQSPTLFLRDFRTTFINELSYDSNAFASQDSQEKRGVWYLKSDITASAALQRRNNSYLVSYSVIDNRDFEGTTDSFRNQRTYVNLKQELALRNILTFSWQHDVLHETLGSGVLEGVETDEFTALKVSRDKYQLAYALGDDNSKLSVNSELYWFEQVYEQSDAVVDVGSYQQLGTQWDLNYNLGARTSSLVSWGYDKYDYRLDDLEEFVGIESLDATSWHIDAGFSREVGRRSHIKFQAGNYQRSFDADRESESIMTWSLEYTMNRRSYSRISASFGQQFSPSRGFGTFIKTDSFRSSLMHSWNDRLKSRNILAYHIDDFIDTDRVDHRLSVSSLLEYSFSEQWRLTGGWRLSDRHSTDDTFDFNRSLVFIRSTYQF